MCAAALEVKPQQKIKSATRVEQQRQLLNIPTEVAYESAAFVLDSLKEINDSGIYTESLHLQSIAAADIIDGLYHSNTVLTVEFSSPHFASGNETELFEIIVMEGKPRLEEGGDGETAKRSRGYAIDRFPEMKDDEIEATLQRKVERTMKQNKEVRNEILSWHSST